MKKVVMLMGGNASGKTTVLDRVHDRLESIPCATHDHCAGGSCKDSGVVWIHADTTGPIQLKAPLPQQFKRLMRAWVDPTIQVIVLEGVRIYSTVFRCAVMSTQYRLIAMASLLRTHEVGCAHIRQRCEKLGKVYRKDTWEGNVTLASNNFRDRYERAGRKFAEERPDLVLDLQEFWISEDYRELPAVEQWMMKHIRGERNG